MVDIVPGLINNSVPDDDAGTTAFDVADIINQNTNDLYAGITIEAGTFNWTIPTLTVGTFTVTGISKLQGDVIIGSGSGATAHTNADDLVIESSGISGMSLLAPSTSFIAMYFGDSVSNTLGRIEYSLSASATPNLMTFFTNNVIALTLDAAQNTKFVGTVALGGAAISTSFHSFHKTETGDADNDIIRITGGGATHVIYAVTANGYNGANTFAKFGKDNVTGRTLNLGGTLNASGADFAEYRELIERLYGKTLKGQLLGYNSEGLLTDRFTEVTGRFCIKSTDPAYVGNDVWGNEEAIGKRPEEPREENFMIASELLDKNKNVIMILDDGGFSDASIQYESSLASFKERLEVRRTKVDRIAIAGIVPVNVSGITVVDVGTYLVPIANSDGTIGAIAIDEDNLTLPQYIKSFGAIERIDDGIVMAAVKTC